MGNEDGSGPVLVTTKLRPPAVRDQTVPRQRLLERLSAGSGLRLSLVACPAGYGKTTLLGGWREAEAARRPVGWVSLDEGDDDPVVLWSYVIEALRRACPALSVPALPQLAGAGSVVGTVLPCLVNELDDLGEVALILDDFDRLSDGVARESIAWFVDHAPPAFQLVLSTRTEPDLPLAALRAHGELLELRADDLRFTSEEADAFLNGRLALGLLPEDVEGLLDRVEGWPAGLYLTALSLMRTADRHVLVNELGVSSRHAIDFLKTEVLRAHDPPVQDLMLRSSILDRLSGPLCDAVLEQQHSAPALDALSRSNLFLVPLDEEGGWYQFHPLFARLLRVELERREPGLAAVLHRRAYAWYRDHGTAGEAISHAIAADAYAEAAELIEASWVRYANACKYATVLAWIRRFPDEILSGDVRLVLVAAWVLSLAARREEAAHAIAAVEELGETGVERSLPDGFSSIESSLTMLRAVFPWGDVGAQLSHGRRAAELEGPGSPWRPVACWAVGMGLYWRGEFGEADQWFAEAAALAPASGRWLAGGSSLAYRSLIAGEQGRLGDQRLLAEQATELVRERGIEEAVGEVPLALGVSIIRRGRPERALPLIDRGVAVSRSAGQPIELAQALLRQAAVLRQLGERERSQSAIAEARFIVESCPDPGILTEKLKAFQPGPQPGPGSADATLTDGELRVLRLLRSDLSERDIGQQLYISHSTVHSHVRSIYRKLGVCSRAEAMERTRELRLLTRVVPRQPAGRAGSPAIAGQAC
jgi:LuxR family transcriptional regulator, maltose regulon positive regulatory protein